MTERPLISQRMPSGLGDGEEMNQSIMESAWEIPDISERENWQQENQQSLSSPDVISPRRKNQSKSMNCNQNVKCNNIDAVELAEIHYKIEALEIYSMNLESSLLEEKKLRKDLEQRFMFLQEEWLRIPRKQFKLGDKNFMFLYKLISKEDPVIRRNVDDIAC